MSDADSRVAYIHGTWSTFTGLSRASLVFVILGSICRDNPGTITMVCTILAIVYLWVATKRGLRDPESFGTAYRAGMVAGVAIFFGLPAAIMAVYIGMAAHR